MKWLTRMFTLPKRYNSLSDVMRDPIGAIANAAQWAVPLAMGMPQGFASLPKLLSNPALIGKWSLGNAPAFFGMSKAGGGWDWAKAGAWLRKPENLALLAGGLSYLDQSRRAQQATSAMDAYRQQLESLQQMERLLNMGLLQRRLGAIGTLLDPGYQRAQLRRLEDEYAQRVRRQLAQAGVAGVRSAEDAVARNQAGLMQALAELPLQHAQLAFGLPLSTTYTPLVGNLLGQRYAQELASLESMLPALLQLYAYTRGQQGGVA